jgi:hypothetical protein
MTIYIYLLKYVIFKVQTKDFVGLKEEQVNEVQLQGLSRVSHVNYSTA